MPAVNSQNKRDEALLLDAELKSSIKAAQKLGVSKTTVLYQIRHTKAQNIVWSPSEEEVLKSSYYDLPKEDLLILLPNRSWNGIVNCAGRLGIHRKLGCGKRQVRAVLDFSGIDSE